MNKIIYTWKDLDGDCKKLCSLVEGLDFKPDFIIGIVRGGSVPATILSHYFNVPVVHLDWSIRDGKVKNTRLLDSICVKASHDTKFLLVDDILDSGKTFQEIKARCFDTKNNILYTSLWYNPDQTLVNINLWVRLIDRSIDERWVVFPYEKQ